MVALVAIHRAWAREGPAPLSREEIAVRIGLKSVNLLEPSVLELMTSRGWLSQKPLGYELTPSGLAMAISIG